MATKDNNIQYELLFFNEFYRYAYPDAAPEHHAFYLATLLNGEIQISTFMENAVANAAGLRRSSVSRADLNDGSEVKTAVSSLRNNHIVKGDWMHTYEVSNVSTKTGPLRVIGYNKITEEFEYFYIPYEAYYHLKGVMTLPIERFRGCYSPPTFTGIRTIESKWDKYQLPNFASLCAKIHQSSLNISSQDQYLAA